MVKIKTKQTSLEIPNFLIYEILKSFYIINLGM